MKGVVAVIFVLGLTCPWGANALSAPATGPSGTACVSQGKCTNQLDGAMFADSSSSGYIVCQCQCEIAMPCPSGLVFNENLSVCDWPNSGSAPGSGSGSGTGSNPGTDTGNNPGTGTGSNPGTGSGSNPGTGSGTVTVCTNQPEGTLLAVNGVCNKFYNCNFGAAMEQTCPGNLHFDATNGICDYPENVKCPWPSTPPSGPAAGPSGIACPSGGRCVGKPNGTFLPSKTDCSKYVVCQCECEVDMACSSGLYWDTALLTCNFANNVTCTL